MRGRRSRGAALRVKTLTRPRGSPKFKVVTHSVTTALCLSAPSCLYVSLTGLLLFCARFEFEDHANFTALLFLRNQHKLLYLYTFHTTCTTSAFQWCKLEPDQYICMTDNIHSF